MSSAQSQLPAPAANQHYFDVSALEAGCLDIPDALFISDGVPGAVTKVPALSFLLTHSQTKQRIIFDLGIRRDWENLSPTNVKWIQSSYTVYIEQDAVQSLKNGGLEPGDISTIILSHCHWDHTGDTALFPTSKFIVGKECQSLFDPGYPEDPKGRFHSNLLPKGRTEYLDPSSWPAVGPFPRALDYLGDGSLYIIDSPGHLPGHITVLIRTSSDGGWLYLAGDAAHFWSQITGHSKISVGAPWNPNFCMHVDKAESEAGIERIKALLKLPRVRVLLAHDAPWYKENKGGDAFFPGKIPSL